MVVVGIVAQLDNERAHQLATSLVRLITDHGDEAVVDEATGEAIGAPSTPLQEMNDCAFVVSIGGDGTFLFVARETGGVPLVGVNLGEVGFLNAVNPAHATEAVEALLHEVHDTGGVTGRTVDRLQASGDGWTLDPALNEIVVLGSKRGPVGGIDVTVEIDGERYVDSPADGALVATPTGSTAYNLSEGGPLLQPTVDAFVVNQMCASEAMPPLVVETDSEITLRVTGSDTAWAISDGRNRHPLDPPETVTVTATDEPITLAGPTVNFFEALEKLE